MILLQDILNRMRKIDHSRPSPSIEQQKAFLSDGRSRILKKSEQTILCDDSNKYFEFCISQISSFCMTSYNAVEIAYATNIQPIYIASAISVYGPAWADHLFGFKRIADMDRGKNTVWKSGYAWFVLSEVQRRLMKSSMCQEMWGARSTLHFDLKKGNVERIVEHARTNPNFILSMLEKKTPIYTDPRTPASIRASVKAAPQHVTGTRTITQIAEGTFNRTLRAATS